MLKLLLSFFLVATPASIMAQGGLYVDTTIKYDSVTANESYDEDEDSYEDDDGYGEILGDTFVTIRELSIPNDTLLKMSNDKSFAYMKNLDSLLKDFQEKKVKKSSIAVNQISFLGKLFSSRILNFLFITIAIVFVAYIVYRLFLQKGHFFKWNKSAKTVEEVQEEDQDFLNQNFDFLINAEKKNGNYRMAIRYLFLKTLRQLNDRQAIQYATEKTNTMYLTEISAELKPKFAHLLQNYEYAWYGYTHISEELFNSIENKFNKFFETGR